jgi:hypothetical protein
MLHTILFARIRSFLFQSGLHRTLFIALFFGVGISPVYAACHVVMPGGSGSKTGVDWNNAYAGLPATLVRGDIYYLADGSYHSYTFNTPASGKATIEIRKAQSYDNCTSTGWNQTMMGSSQAVFERTSSAPIFNIGTSYVTVNGNGVSTAAGCGEAGASGTSRAQDPPKASDCGIKVDNSSCTSSASGSCDAPIKFIESGITNVTLKYVEALGNNNNVAEQMLIFAPYGGYANQTYTHLFMHNAGCVYIQDGQQSESVTYSYFWGNNTSAGGCHGQASFSDGAESNTTYANNVFRDINGTAVWTFAANSTKHDSWLFYNNVIWNDSQADGQQEDGIIACINSGTDCTNFIFAQNTMANLNYNTGAVFSNAGGSITFENNLWYLCEGTSGRPGGISFTMAGSTLREDYNSFIQSGGNFGGGAHDVFAASAPDPFVSWTSGNFNLASENTDWENRFALGAPFTTDPNGTKRTTDRGAYQSLNTK